MKYSEIAKKIHAYEQMAKSPLNNTSNHAKNILNVLYTMQERWANDWYDEESDFNFEYDSTVQDPLAINQRGNLSENETSSRWFIP